MKKAFDANVSRARPRVRLSASSMEGGQLVGDETTTTSANDVMSIEAIAAAIAAEPPQPSLAMSLKGAVKERAQALYEPKPTVAQTMQAALQAPPPAPTPVVAYTPPVTKTYSAPPVPDAAPVAIHRSVVATIASAPVRMHAEAPAPVTEVQTAPLHEEQLDGESDRRRERLKERLKAVRENPKPEPLPETVAEAGVLAVERISALQTELTKVRALNLALTQDLEGARRQAERATEERGLRVDEAQRLSGEMESRSKLLSELERELSSLEGERDEALLSLQDARASIDAKEVEKDGLKGEILKREQALAESLSEEERLAAELEDAHETSTSMRKTCEALRTERDTLARQVSELTLERADLLEARKALQAVHRALTQAVSR